MSFRRFLSRALLIVVALEPASIWAAGATPAETGKRQEVQSSNEPISPAEYRLFLLRERAQVYAEVQEQQPNNQHADTAWETKLTNGKTAREELRARAYTHYVRARCELVLAHELGQLNDASYSSFLQEFTEENKRRRDALTKGQPIYGPPQYRLDVYYFVRLAGLRQTSLDVLKARIQSKLSEDALREYLQTHSSEFNGRSFAEAKPHIVTALANAEYECRMEALRSAMPHQLDNQLLTETENDILRADG